MAGRAGAMGETKGKDATGRRRRWLLRGLTALSGAAVALAIAVALLVGRTIEIPDWAADRIEAAVNARLPTGRIALDGMSVSIDRWGVPRLRLNGVSLADETGQTFAELPRVGARLSARALLDGRIAPRRISLSGALVTMRRDAQGRIALSLGAGRATRGTLGAVLTEVEAAFDRAPLDGLSEITADSVTISLEDARSGRVWQVTDGELEIENSDDRLGITVDSDVFNGSDTLGRARMSFVAYKSSPQASFSAEVRDMAAADIAAQSPALSFLDPIDAPISGALRGAIAADGSLGRMDGTLQLGAGAVQPTPGSRPVAFSSGRAYFDFDPAAQKLTFTELSAVTDLGALSVSGHAYMRDFSGGWPATLLGQLRLDRASLSEEGVFDPPLTLDSGAVDLRLRLDPFRLTLGQVTIRKGATRVVGDGAVSAGPEGWQVALDLGIDAIGHGELLGFWPLEWKPRTRDWIARNIAKGRVTDANAALRLAQGTPPRIALTYDFTGAEVRLVKTLPPATGARGRTTIADDRFALAVERAAMTPAGGGAVDISGSSFVIPDMRKKPARAEIALAADGRLPDILRIMDNPPFRVLSRANRGPDLATARAEIAAAISFDMKHEIRPPDVDYRVTGTLHDLVSTTLVPGRRLEAESLDVAIDRKALRIGGAGTIDGVPIDADWHRPLGTPEAAAAGSTVSGTVELAPRTLDAFEIGLPDDMVSGRGRGDFEIALAPDAPPELDLTSTLSGIGLSLGAVGWSKPAGTEGRLDLAARLGAAPRVERLQLSAPGLDAAGTVELGDGGVDARFSRVRIGGWLDGAVRLSGRGAGRPPAITVSGGAIDLRRARLGAGGAGGGPSRPLRLSLDRLTVSEGIVFAPFEADLTAGGGGLAGDFRARVAGGTPVRGSLAPGQGGTAIRLVSDDAGQALADAGVFRNAEGGKLDLSLTPTGAAGSYRGQLRVGEVVLKDAPAMAALLDAVSVVGLIDELNGPGIRFSRVEADFRLTPERIFLDSSSAEGASLGVAMDGTFDLGSKRLDLQGVVSPFYFLNGIGQILTRRGEGLFGVSFRLGGTAAAPSVRVNPLSILTPGMFREIFRRPPPQATQ